LGGGRREETSTYDTYIRTYIQMKRREEREEEGEGEDVCRNEMILNFFFFFRFRSFFLLPCRWDGLEESTLQLWRKS
jgi:hypothetical protein